MIVRRVFAEALGSAMLSGVVIGSGIMASNLAAGNAALALLANTVASASILFALIVMLGPVSGAHFNPAVTLSMAVQGEITLPATAFYIPAQILGCVAGVWLAHAMFGLPLLQSSSHVRAGATQILSEGVATFALVLAIFGSARHGVKVVAATVALVIAAGYWWTASTSFANPAITIARALSDTFAGVRPADVPGFILGQLAGAALAVACGRWLFVRDNSSAQ